MLKREVGKASAIAKKGRRRWNNEQVTMIERCLTKCRLVVIRQLAQLNTKQL